ncbi:MAG: hypothetical protein M1819_006539 [Sarea resinae]|nr:MAG: hypothetical protein M1819_006539 [Sarea resinae]
MDGRGGLVGFQWMFLIYGLITVLVGISLLWWLPDRPLPPGQIREKGGWRKFIPKNKPALEGEDARIHYEDLTRVYHQPAWKFRDFLRVFMDWRLWPLLMMYFGVVGVGIGVQNYGNVIIASINPNLSGIDISLLFAPIWIMDLIAILLVTPFSDRFNHHRALFFSIPVCIQIIGLVVTTYAGGPDNPWPRYGGLLIIGFGLGPTVPITMTWTSEIFQPRHGELGVAAASAIVSGWGNCGSILTTYALYEGWSADARPGPKQFRKSNLVMIGILCASIVSSLVLTVLLRFCGGEPGRMNVDDSGHGAVLITDGAARREARQRGLRSLWRR